LPPLVLSLLFPFGFVIVIGYAGAAATVWTCIIPALLVRKARMLETGDKGFRAPGGQVMIYLVMGFGVLTAVFHIMSMLGFLPSYVG
jgi:tryptophan-specific transport protein